MKLLRGSDHFLLGNRICLYQRLLGFTEIIINPNHQAKKQQILSGAMLLKVFFFCILKHKEEAIYYKFMKIFLQLKTQGNKRIPVVPELETRCITAVIAGPDSRRTGCFYVAYIKCDPGARAFCKCANVDALPAIVMLLPAASSVPAQKHAL